MTNSFQGSRWSRHHLLLAPEELSQFFETLGIDSLYPLGRPVAADKPVLLPQEAAGFYAQLYAGEAVNFAWAADLGSEGEGVLAMPLAGGRMLWKVQKPLLQITPFYFAVSSQGEILPKAMGATGGVFWGLQIFFPQLYRECETGEILSLPHDHPLRKIAAWVRKYTKPVTFIRNTLLLRPGFRIGEAAIELAEERADLVSYNLTWTI